MDVDLRGFDGFVSEPERDHRLIGAMVQQFHRCAVPENMRANPFSDQRWARS